MKIAIYIFIMAVTTYLIRMIPFAVFTKKIKLKFIQSFLYYIPYTVLSAMTIPAVFYSTGNVNTAYCGTLVAVILSFLRLPLIVVAIFAALTVFITSFFF